MSTRKLTTDPHIIKQRISIFAAGVVPVHRAGHVCLLNYSLVKEFD